MLTAQEATRPAFHALVYSIDVFVPLIDLCQAKFYLPKDGWVQVYHWVHIGAGWVLSTLLAVGLTGLVRR